MSRRVLVTGGAGFIGSELVAQLVASGETVTVLDNFATGEGENLPAGIVDLVRGDVRDAALLESLTAGFHTIYHLACLGLRHSLYSPAESHDVNATGTLRILQAALKAGVRRFVHVSSSEIYGTARRVPMDENHPAYPTTPYGAAKLAGEGYARAFHLTYGLPVVIVRPFNAYGPRCHFEGDRGEVIPRFLERLWKGQPLLIYGDGRQTRDFTYVSDTARGILLAGSRDEAIGGTFNLGSGRTTAIGDLPALLAQAAGRPLPLVRHEVPRPGDVRHLQADSSLARRVLGYSPGVEMDAGLQSLIDWYSGKEAAV